ncbi:MAG: hypothetical protein DRR04_06440 [Gammaproteobacteria bacterium]|nr:MAG: hypothetical protein DRQ97_07785 [Gammaproteobacteria bacterium]RLA60186.1 MAG: hypothetical protein DRR04_06440 [Gammaproteobacteria bacterium]
MVLQKARYKRTPLKRRYQDTGGITTQRRSAPAIHSEMSFYWQLYYAIKARRFDLNKVILIEIKKIDPQFAMRDIIRVFSLHRY